MFHKSRVNAEISALLSIDRIAQTRRRSTHRELIRDDFMATSWPSAAILGQPCRGENVTEPGVSPVGADTLEADTQTTPGGEFTVRTAPSSVDDQTGALTSRASSGTQHTDGSRPAHGDPVRSER